MAHFEIKDLSFSYPTANGKLALKNINLKIERGEYLTVCGKSGSGKTTLMNMIYGIYYPDSGHILVDGKEVTIRSPKDSFALGIGMVHQHFMLVPNLTVAENMVLGMEPKHKGMFMDYKKAVEITEEYAKKYNLHVDPNAKVRDIPVGMKQKVEILKALVRGAKILILDEPTRGIDVGAKYEIYELMEEMAREGKCVVMISSEMPELMGMSDRIMVMCEGHNSGILEGNEIQEERIMLLASTYKAEETGEQK